MKAVAGTTVTLVLTPLVVGCGSDNTPAPTTSSTTPTNPAPTPTGCDGAGATSTSVLGHTHDVCVPLADINAPPAAGQTYTTSAASTDGHVHQLSLTQAMLMALAAGQTIVVTTSVVESHTHDFSLVENGQATSTPTPTPTATGPY